MLSQLVLITLLQAQSGLPEPSWDIPGVEIDDQHPEVSSFLASSDGSVPVQVWSALARWQCHLGRHRVARSGGADHRTGARLAARARRCRAQARSDQPWQSRWSPLQGTLGIRPHDRGHPGRRENPQPWRIIRHFVVWDVNMKPGSSLECVSCSRLNKAFGRRTATCCAWCRGATRPEDTGRGGIPSRVTCADAPARWVAFPIVMRQSAAPQRQGDAVILATVRPVHRVKAGNPCVR